MCVWYSKRSNAPKLSEASAEPGPIKHEMSLYADDVLLLFSHRENQEDSETLSLYVPWNR